ncbi:MAG: hypothetical protein ABIA67_04610 [Candidatus Margulisiibacteriota bacterium]
MIKVKPLFGGFGKSGERVSEQDGIYALEGTGTDIGCNLVLQEEINNPSLLELEIRGEIKKESEWTRLRIEIFDRNNPDVPATSFENEYLPLDLNPDNFKHISFPILGIVLSPIKIQFMVVGPAETRLEIRNVTIR